jgi:hypothetical protein
MGGRSSHKQNHTPLVNRPDRRAAPTRFCIGSEQRPMTVDQFHPADLAAPFVLRLVVQMTRLSAVAMRSQAEIKDPKGGRSKIGENPPGPVPQSNFYGRSYGGFL